MKRIADLLTAERKRESYFVDFNRGEIVSKRYRKSNKSIKNVDHFENKGVHFIHIDANDIDK